MDKWHKLLKVISANEILLLAKLKSYKLCTISDNELAEFFNVKRITIQTWLKDLERHNLIIRTWDGITREITVNTEQIERIVNETEIIHKAV